MRFFYLKKKCSQVQRFFFSCLNTKHRNLKLTYEIDEKLTDFFSVRYSSFSPKLYKPKSISTLTNRAYICYDRDGILTLQLIHTAANCFIEHRNFLTRNTLLQIILHPYLEHFNVRN